MAMNARLVWLIVLLTGLANTGPARAASQESELCHIANAGFALHTSKGAVLIDALFRAGLPDYQRASDDLIERMETGAVPFDDVKFVIASHVHADHFHAQALVRHAGHNPGTRYIVTPQAHERMIAAGLADPSGKRVHATYPSNDENRTLEHQGIAVTVYRISHGKGNSTQNIGTLIEADGVRLFHTGDMEPYADELMEAGLENLAVDAALVPFWVLMSDENRRLMGKVFAAELVVPMHVPDREQDWMAEYGGLSGLRRLIEAGVPNAAWMTGEMDCRKIGTYTGLQ